MTSSNVVFDSVVFLQALARRNGPAAACWKLVEERRYLHFISEETMLELADVFNRPALAKKLGFRKETASDFLLLIRGCSIFIPCIPSVFPYARDPKDERFVDLALHVQASYLVTWDKDLLGLMIPGSVDGERLELLSPHLTILTPPDLLRVQPA